MGIITPILKQNLNKPSISYPILFRLFLQNSFGQNQMFWALETGEKSQSWARAVRSVLCIFGGKLVSFDLPTLGIKTTNQTSGHRFLSPDIIEISSFADYQSKLEKSFVMLDHLSRQTYIWEGLEALAHQKGLNLLADESLLQEVAGLVEYPVPLLGAH